MYIGFGCSMSIVLFHGFIKNIPVELEEAATIDGCNMFQTFFLIVLPLLKGIMATVAVINVMWIWNDFLLECRHYHCEHISSLVNLQKNGIWRQQHLYFV